jgi:LuxR family maltose regulon positive regulatory protein
MLLRLGAAVARARMNTAVDLDWMLTSEPLEDRPSDLAILMRALSQMRRPSTLVLDNAQLIRSAGSKAALRDVIGQVSGHVQVIVSSRSEPDLPLARLRSSGALLELNQDDLSLDPSEVAQLLDAVAKPPWTAEGLMSATGGWPAAISLLLASDRKGADDPASTGEADHRFLAEYVRSEVLPQLSRSRREFLMKTSPLERITGGLADAVTEGTDSSKFLRRLASSTHLVHQVDAAGEWYVVNRVLLRVLRSDFESSNPDVVTEVHGRAADWYRAHDMPLEAIGHAQKAGDPDRFVDLMAQLVKDRFASGHVADVLLWMDWLQANVNLDRYPSLAAIGALVLVQEGRVLESERWLEAASKSESDPDTATIIRLVRAAGTRSGVGQMFKDLDAAEKTAEPGSRWTPAIMVTRGLAHVLEGDTDEAERCFVEAARLGQENKSLASLVLALGQRALIAIGRQDWDLASSLSTRAVTIIDERGMDGYQVSGPALVAAARCARHSNDVVKTKALLARASLVRPRLSAAIPGESVQILSEMAKAYVELSDVVGARALIREADDILIQRPNLGVLSEQLETLRSSLSALGPGTIGLSALTKAELRLLPFLATNLSFPEIGEQLYISRHTVKTQAMSIYRKLGASSRSEAVTKAYEAGLLQR